MNKSSYVQDLLQCKEMDAHLAQNDYLNVQLRKKMLMALRSLLYLECIILLLRNPCILQDLKNPANIASTVPGFYNFKYHFVRPVKTSKMSTCEA